MTPKPDPNALIAKCVLALTRNERRDGRQVAKRTWAAYTPEQREARAQRMTDARRDSGRRKKETSRG